MICVLLFFCGLDHGISIKWAVWVPLLAGAVWVYQLFRGLGSFNGLACLCISVGSVRLAVLWRFCRLVVTWCFKDLCGYNWAATCDFQQCGILTSVDSYAPVLPPFKLRNSKWCGVSSLTVIQATWKGSDQTACMRRLIWARPRNIWK